MNTRWQWKTYSALFLIVFAVYLLIPSFFDFQLKREIAEKEGVSVPWYTRVFPQSQINLGLDLQGGIYIEFEVIVTEALMHRSESMVTEIERFLKEKGIPYKLAQVLPKTSTIGIFLDKPEDRSALRDHVRDIYGNSLRELKSPPLLTFQFQSSNSEENLPKYQEVVKWAKDRPDILDVTLNQNILEVVLKKEEGKEEIQQAVLNQFGGALQLFEPAAALYWAQSDIFQSRLKDETMKQAVETIRNRIDRHGVAEPTIQRLGENRVAIEMPGVRDPDRAIGIVKQAGKLEFKLVDESIPEDKVKELVASAREENKIPSGFTEDVVNQINDALKGKIPPEDEIAFEVLYDPITKKITGGIPYLLKRKVEVSGNMLRNAQVSVQNNEPYVALSFNPAGTKVFADLTTANVGKRLAILLDGVVSKAPQIKSPIPSGEAQITLGGRDYQSLLREAEDLVVVLREGALPATLKEATKTIIGPSLGKSSIQRGLNATLLAAAIVIVFMGLWYRWSGVLADLAVILNVFFILAALTLFGATLTLPGVAGIVLTIGMAVDANVIILERIKDELALGKTIKVAVDAGYSNGMRAVIDANLTTFLSGMVLYQFGTGPVRGFAVTLMIGIITTLYTAVVMTRLVYDYFLTKRKITKLSL